MDLSHLFRFALVRPNFSSNIKSDLLICCAIYLYYVLRTWSINYYNTIQKLLEIKNNEEKIAQCLHQCLFTSLKIATILNNINDNATDLNLKNMAPQRLVQRHYKLIGLSISMIANLGKAEKSILFQIVLGYFFCKHFMSNCYSNE